MEKPLAASTWEPLRIGVFRAMWLAALVSNVGSWMQTVGAQWLLVDAPHAAFLVAMVQVADMVPDFAFGLVGGVLADTLDRRRLLIAVQAGLVVVCSGLTVLTWLHLLSPTLLLVFTFVLGFGSVISTPAFQSLVPELVPRDQLPAASALSSISINLARAIGPALAGVLIAKAGVAAVFAINTVTFAVFGIVIALWHAPRRKPARRPERFGPAMLAGVRYIRYSPVVMRILTRATLFLIPASALWALLPLIASSRLHSGAGGYGVLLGALGVGAITGAFVLPYLAQRLSRNARLAGGTAVYAAVMAGVAVNRVPALSVLMLVPAGVAWLAILADFNAELQLFLPVWVRARGLSIYQMVFFGAQAFGAVLWGAVAGPLGLVTTFVLAGASLLATALTLRWWPLIDTKGLDRNTVISWPDPRLVIAQVPDDVPVAVRSTYRVAKENEKAFLKAMARVRLSRLRTGASEWSLYRNAEDERVFMEFFVAPSWEEHMRQHTDRQTGTDQRFEEEVEAFSEKPVATLHLISVPVDR
ncbi:MAG TPA: MFS transporter [Gemmatimonadales bacterium]|jgi:MFS family permease|nr:MFS transporter [Gemmatimonadales bacterium]